MSQRVTINWTTQVTEHHSLNVDMKDVDLFAALVILTGSEDDGTVETYIASKEGADTETQALVTDRWINWELENADV